MTDQKAEKDYFILYVAMTAVILVGIILAVKGNETDKFEPIKELINEENRLMNIRVLD